MKLGLCCMLRNQTMKKGFTGIKAVSVADQSTINKKTSEATLHNIKQSDLALDWVIENKLSAFRISSELIPFFEYWDWKSNKEIISKLQLLNKKAKNASVKLLVHPDQYVVLNSKSEDVINNSLSVIYHHYDLTEFLDLKNIIIHTGGVFNDKQSSINKFIQTIKDDVPDYIQELITLENCHYYNPDEISFIKNNILKIQTVYDLHHARVITKREVSVEEHIENIKKMKPSLLHIASGRNYLIDSSHHEFISEDDIKTLIDIQNKFPDIICEVEAKAKNHAISKMIEFDKGC